MNHLSTCWAFCLISAAWLCALPAATSYAAGEVGPQVEVLDLDDAALLLRVTPEIVRDLAEKHRIPARRVGEVWRFSRVALLEWLRGGQLSNEASATTEAPQVPDQGGSLAGKSTAVNRHGMSQVVSDTTTPAGSPLSKVGEAPATPTAEEVALRDQVVLLKRGAATVDFDTSYSYSEHASFPVLRQEQRSFGASIALRYGLLNDLQITARVPHVWSRTTTFVDAAISGATAPVASHDDYSGDGSISLLGVASRESVGGPNIVWSLDSIVPSGPGDRGVGGGLVFSKSYDPAVIFAGLSYLRGLSVDPANARRSLARNNVGLAIGYTYALNDSLALSTLLTGTYRNTSSPDGASIPPARERYQLQLGMTWLLSRGLFIEPAVAMGLGSDNPNLAVMLNIPYSF